MDPLVWRCRDHTFRIGARPLVMGIVNVTPDSFSDGGRFFDPQLAIDHGLRLVAEGADLLDVGGESTRPGAEEVPAAEELRRVLPVVRELVRRAGVPVSVDTSKATIARACLDAGATIVNDVTGLTGDRDMPAVCAEAEAGVVVMHMQGDPRTMQANPTYADVVGEVGGYLADRLATLEQAGIRREAICLDPGIGFGKALAHTLTQLNHLADYRRFGRPVCLGVSRKGFIGQLTGRPRGERMPGSLAVACFAMAGFAAQVLRVHDVAPTRDAAVLFEAISTAGQERS
ncbi:MAG: dihydropteroate synthase [Gemmataceae bacterium]